MNEDGSYVEARETAMRPLTEAGVKELQQVRHSFTRGFENVTVPSAYTLKKDGTKIALGQGDFLYGRGAKSAPGFEDVLTMTFVFRASRSETRSSTRRYSGNSNPGSPGNSLWSWTSLERRWRTM